MCPLGAPYQHNIHHRNQSISMDKEASISMEKATMVAGVESSNGFMFDPYEGYVIKE